ncbi:MAG: hypothetical protein RL596_2433 [Bacteroidota bacterium]|jgi:hypothetical protein
MLLIILSVLNTLESGAFIFNSTQSVFKKIFITDWHGLTENEYFPHVKNFGRTPNRLLQTLTSMSNENIFTGINTAPHGNPYN